LNSKAELFSKGMLEAHINPEGDSATRNHKFTSEELRKDLYEAGFDNVDFYGDVSGS